MYQASYFNVSFSCPSFLMYALWRWWQWALFWGSRHWAGSQGSGWISHCQHISNNTAISSCWCQYWGDLQFHFGLTWANSYSITIYLSEKFLAEYPGYGYWSLQKPLSRWWESKLDFHQTTSPANTQTFLWNRHWSRWQSTFWDVACILGN